MAGRKLKVFQAQFGFYDTVVAAPSQAAALRAWGVNQNLFASGEAKAATDEAAIAAATAHPETPLRRAVGSTEPLRWSRPAFQTFRTPQSDPPSHRPLKPSLPDRPNRRRIGLSSKRPRRH